MQTIELHRWLVTCPDTGRVYRTRHAMTAADAQAVDTLAQPVPGTCERRLVPDGPSEHALTSAWRGTVDKK